MGKVMDGLGGRLLSLKHVRTLKVPAERRRRRRARLMLATLGRKRRRLVMASLASLCHYVVLGVVPCRETRGGGVG